VLRIRTILPPNFLESRFYEVGGIAANVDALHREGTDVDHRPKPEQHDTFEQFMELERARLQEHAQGKLARALGHALPGESQEELERIAAEDQRMAKEGMAKLKVGEEIYYKHIDELTREDRTARMAAEQEEVDWLVKRVRLSKERSP
jgi:hypothetical protein